MPSHFFGSGGGGGNRLSETLSRRLLSLHDLNRASTSRLAYIDTGRHPIRQLRDMRDYSNQAIGRTEILDTLEHRVERLRIKRSKSLIEEERLKCEPAVPVT